MQSQGKNRPSHYQYWKQMFKNSTPVQTSPSLTHFDSPSFNDLQFLFQGT